MSEAAGTAVRNRLESCGAGNWDWWDGRGYGEELAGLQRSPYPQIGSGIKAQLQTTLAEFKDTRAKLMEQESALKELQDRGES